jgi:DNA repair protein RadC
MKHIAVHDRPREKLERCGAETLGDNELLAVVIGHGRRQGGALAVANDVLAAAGGVQELTRLHRALLERVPGVGPAQAARILAAVELGRRTLTTPQRERPRFLTPEDAGAYLLPRFGAYPVERFGALLLDVRYRLIATRLLSVGGLDASLAHPREVFREALLAGAAVVLVFHNHPSGDPEPSEEDVASTARLKAAGAVIGVTLLDHLVLADSRYCSMRQMGLI